MTADATTSDGPNVRVLTISATYGTGGGAAARLLARRLGLPFADRVLHPRGPSPAGGAERISEQELDEEPRSALLQGLALLGSTSNIPVTRDQEDIPERVRKAVEASIRELLTAGGAVILGRAAAIALGRRPGAFHVRLDGPMERRALRGALWEDVDLATARARLTETDNARIRYMQRVYGRDPGDQSLYHLVLDATVMTIDEVVELIATAAAAAWKYDDRRLVDDIAAMHARLTEES